MCSIDSQQRAWQRQVPLSHGISAFGIALRPEWSALLMSASSIIVALNAVLLRGVERELSGPAAQPSAATGRPALAV
jgi:Cu2+-exporting ATPase